MPERPQEEISTQPTLEATATEPPSGDRPEELQPGTRFGDYDVVARIGRGGMGIVYKARHRTLDRAAALKILDGGGGPRFLREARSAAQLEHHNIVAVRHAGELDGRGFLEMELIEGRSLGQLAGAGPLDPSLATRFVEQVAHALQHAHSRGIVHRDIKPDNILVSEDGVAKVTDFGLAKPTVLESSLTAPGSILGTPAYMAPEQWQGNPADARTDLYALGATYFHLLLGRPPFGGKLVDLLRQHTEAPVPDVCELNPAVPAAIGPIVRRLMAKKPEERYQTAAELIGDLRRAQNPVDPAQPAPAERPSAPGEPREPEPGPAPEPLAAPAARSRQLLFALIVGLLLGTLALGADGAGLFLGIERRLEDARMQRRPATPRFPDLRLLLADDAFAARYGTHFDRKALADLLEALRRTGAGPVAVDLLLAEPGPGEDDAILAASTRSAPGTIHAMYLYRGGPDEGSAPAPPRLPSRFAARISPEGLPRATRAVLPLPQLVEASAQLGTVGLLVDPDGVVRRAPLLTAYRGHVYPALSLVAVCAALGASVQDLRWQPGQPLVIEGPSRKLRIPVDERAALRLSVRGRLEHRQIVSLAGAIEAARAGTARADASLARTLKGKLLLVGAQVSAHSDVQPLPGIAVAPLVLAHAMAIETMLSEDFVAGASLGHKLPLVMLLALLGVAAGLLLRPALALGLLLVAGALVYLGGGVLLDRAGLLIPTLAPLLALAAGGVAGGVQRALPAKAQRRRLLDALGRYVPRRVAQRVLEDPRALRLGGQRKELTLLSVELQGFAALSERLEPEEVGQLLSKLFAVVAARVQEQEGTLDRFSGEGVRAFFGDPLPLADHATRAVTCALLIRDEALRVLARWASGGRPRPPLGIGVHTGYVTVGNVGSLQRMEYTVLGRNLEVAHRLAAGARDSVLCSGRTRATAGDAFLYERRAPLSDERELEVYEVCCRR